MDARVGVEAGTILLNLVLILFANLVSVVPIAEMGLDEGLERLICPTSGRSSSESISSGSVLACLLSVEDELEDALVLGACGDVGADEFAVVLDQSVKMGVVIVGAIEGVGVGVTVGVVEEDEDELVPEEELEEEVGVVEEDELVLEEELEEEVTVAGTLPGKDCKIAASNSCLRAQRLILASLWDEFCSVKNKFKPFTF